MIHVFSNIPNTKVINIIKNCDVGLLPTWFDTYGYSVLEMQACGLPVITTNIRALPEINNQGWLLRLPVNFNNEVVPNSFEEKTVLRKLIQKQMYDIIINILDHPDIILKHGKASFEYIKKFHSPDIYASNLLDIYNEFL